MLEAAITSPRAHETGSELVLLDRVSRRYAIGGGTVTALEDVSLAVGPASSRSCSVRPAAARRRCST
jgi:hypothetical protein